MRENHRGGRNTEVGERNDPKIRTMELGEGKLFDSSAVEPFYHPHLPLHYLPLQPRIRRGSGTAGPCISRCSPCRTEPTRPPARQAPPAETQGVENRVRGCTEKMPLFTGSGILRNSSRKDKPKTQVLVSVYLNYKYQPRGRLDQERKGGLFFLDKSVNMVYFTIQNQFGGCLF